MCGLARWDEIVILCSRLAKLTLITLTALLGLTSCSCTSGVSFAPDVTFDPLGTWVMLPWAGETPATQASANPTSYVSGLSRKREIYRASGSAFSTRSSHSSCPLLHAKRCGPVYHSVHLYVGVSLMVGHRKEPLRGGFLHKACNWSI